MKKIPQLGFEPRTNHLHDDCSTVELLSYLQRRQTLPLIYFEGGVLATTYEVEGTSFSFQSTCPPRGLIITLILLYHSRLGVFKPPGALTYCLLTDCLQHAIMPETGFFVLFFIDFFITRLLVIAIHLFFISDSNNYKIL